VIGVMKIFRCTKISPERRAGTHRSNGGGKNHNLYSSYQLFGEISAAEVS